MHRFYLSPSECLPSELWLSEADSHHARDVLRLPPGERIAVLDGAGHEFHCQIQNYQRRAACLRVLQRTTLPRPPYELTLVQAIPKGKIMEAILQKATELGASRIVPLLSERIAVQLEAERAEHKAEKWQATVIEAIKQCGAGWLPRVESPVSPKDFLRRNERFDLCLIASLQPDSRHPREYFQSYQAEHGRLPERVAVWVGPEGDFTPAEISAAKSAGALPISLGPLILRCETAAVYCLSVLNYELQANVPTNPESADGTTNHTLDTKRK